MQASQPRGTTKHRDPNRGDCDWCLGPNRKILFLLSTKHRDPNRGDCDPTDSRLPDGVVLNIPRRNTETRTEGVATFIP